MEEMFGPGLDSGYEKAFNILWKLGKKRVANEGDLEKLLGILDELSCKPDSRSLNRSKGRAASLSAENHQKRFLCGSAYY